MHGGKQTLVCSRTVHSSDVGIHYETLNIFRKTYNEKLRKHYEKYFKSKGTVREWTTGPTKKLHPEFYVLEIAPNSVHSMWTYLTVGMSMDRTDDNFIELFVFSPEKNNSLVELLTVSASFHRNKAPLNVHHTVNIGQPWIKNSTCDHGFISLPYLDGEKLESFEFENRVYRCLWFIPITEKERDYKTKNGCEALEQLFDEGPLDYLNPNREGLVL